MRTTSGIDAGHKPVQTIDQRISLIVPESIWETYRQPTRQLFNKYVLYLGASKLNNQCTISSPNISHRCFEISSQCSIQTVVPLFNIIMH